MKHYIAHNQYGRGVYAYRKLKEGDIIMHNRIIIVSKDAVPDYVFNYPLDPSKDCICLGDGELFNHDKNGNVRYWMFRNCNEEDLMVFACKRDIDIGEELFIDYRQDSPGLDLSRYGIKE